MSSGICAPFYGSEVPGKGRTGSSNRLNCSEVNGPDLHNIEKAYAVVRSLNHLEMLVGVTREVANSQ